MVKRGKMMTAPQFYLYLAVESSILQDHEKVNLGGRSVAEAIVEMAVRGSLSLQGTRSKSLGGSCWVGTL